MNCIDFQRLPRPFPPWPSPSAPNWFRFPKTLYPVCSPPLPVDPSQPERHAPGALDHVWGFFPWRRRVLMRNRWHLFPQKMWDALSYPAGATRRISVIYVLRMFRCVNLHHSNENQVEKTACHWREWKSRSIVLNSWGTAERVRSNMNGEYHSPVQRHNALWSPFSYLWYVGVGAS